MENKNNTNDKAEYNKSEYMSLEPSNYLTKEYNFSKKENFSERTQSFLTKSLRFVFVSIPEAIGGALVYLFENIYRVIRIDVGFFNVDKIELSETINKLKYKLVETRDENTALDNDNYLLTSANKELISAGIEMHDELCVIYGENHHLVLKWKRAEIRSNAKLEIDYSESSEYLSIRQRRDLELWKTELKVPYSESKTRRHIQPKSSVSKTKTKTAPKKKRSKN